MSRSGSDAADDLELRALLSVEGRARVLVEALHIALSDERIEHDEERRIKLRDVAMKAIHGLRGDFASLDAVRELTKKHNLERPTRQSAAPAHRGPRRG